MTGGVGVTQVQTFSDLEMALSGLSWEGSPSEMHGAICGYLASGRAWADGGWPVELIGAPKQDSAEQVRTIVAMVARRVQESLDSDELDFGPWLADGEASLWNRVETMTLWCRGFLGGFGLGNPEQPLESEVDEVLESFAVFASAPPSLGEEEEEDESAWTELVEFIRVGVLLCYSSLTKCPE